MSMHLHSENKHMQKQPRKPAMMQLLPSRPSTIKSNILLHGQYRIFIWCSSTFEVSSSSSYGYNISNKCTMVSKMYLNFPENAMKHTTFVPSRLLSTDDHLCVYLRSWSQSEKASWSLRMRAVMNVLNQNQDVSRVSKAR